MIFVNFSLISEHEFRLTSIIKNLSIQGNAILKENISYDPPWLVRRNKGQPRISYLYSSEWNGPLSLLDRARAERQRDNRAEMGLRKSSHLNPLAAVASSSIGLGQSITGGGGGGGGGGGVSRSLSPSLSKWAGKQKLRSRQVSERLEELGALVASGTRGGTRPEDLCLLIAWMEHTKVSPYPFTGYDIQLFFTELPFSRPLFASNKPKT